jgi:Zinc dependent phospholipase C
MEPVRRVLAVVGVLALAAMPGGVSAWGYDAHKTIMDKAIALLPQDIRPLFEQNRTTLVEHVIDPDLWQTAGFDSAESPNHFLDLDWDGYGKYPYDGLPRDYTAAVAKFGKDRIEKNGTVPWRVEEMYGNLRRAFESYERRGPFGRFDVLFYSAWLTHYVSDAHVPFHAVVNYDGQLTGQPGIHSRFEAFLFERYRDQWTIAPKAIAPVHNPRDFIFDVVLAGTQLVPPILKSDVEAIGGREEYDDAYYAAFFKANRAVVERRLNEAIAASAAMIAGAWEAAGKPAVPINPKAPPQRRRR